jgi:hypothetical protein
MPDDSAAADSLSPTELLKQAHADATAQYTAKSICTRYGDNNDYQIFKKLIHDASHHGAEAPPLPPSSEWFASEHGAAALGRSRRGENATDNTNNDGESDEELVFAGEVSSLKCPLTLQKFRVPYSNYVCLHTFEKSALLEMFERGATVFYENSQARGRERGVGVRKLKCPGVGCESMLKLEDFYEEIHISSEAHDAGSVAA